MTGHSEQLNELAAALVKAQAAIRVVEATSLACVERNGQERSYRYADLASVWAAVRKPLARHGLSVVQTCEPSSRGELRLTTTLLHESGQWVSGTESIPVAVPTAQGYGSALTYARRYGLAAILGVCVDDDDDGAAASKPAEHAGAHQHASNGSQPKGQRDRAAAAGGESGRGLTGKDATPADGEAWRQVAYNRATESELRAFAQAYAAARDLEAVSSEDIRRDFGVQGRLSEFFGSRVLGEIVDSASSAAPASAGGADDAVREAVLTSASAADRGPVTNDEARP